MKNFGCVFIIFLLIISCSEKRDILHPIYQWDRSDNPKFDSIRIKLQDSFYYGASKCEKQKYLDSLVKILKNDYSPDKQEVVYYWVYRMKVEKIPSPELADSLKQIISNVDSVNRHFNYLMLQSLYSDLNPDPVENYFTTIHLLNQFRQLGDSLQTGRNLMRLARLSDYTTHINKNHPLSAQNYYKQASVAFKNGGIKNYWLKNLLNIAYTSNDSSESIDILKFLRRSETIRKDTDFQALLLENLFALTNDYSYIDTCIDLLKDSEKYHNRMALNYTVIANSFLKKGDLDSALIFNNKSLNLIDSISFPYYYANIYDTRTQIYDRLNCPDSTLKYFSKFIFWKDSVIKENNAEALMRTEAAVKIADIKQMAEFRHQRSLWISGFLILLIFLLFCFLGFIFYHNNKKKEIRSLITEKELEKSRTSLAAQTLILMEKDTLLQGLDNTVAEMKKSNKISDEGARELNVALKIYRSDNLEREDFLKIHEKLHPDFSRKLKADFPDISEGQLRLCVYIAAGLSNSHISRILNIENQSINKNRYRLRKKLGLKSGESLEDFLRNYVK